VYQVARVHAKACTQGGGYQFLILVQIKTPGFTIQGYRYQIIQPVLAPVVGTKKLPGRANQAIELCTALWVNISW